jgi:hypothetical protein
MLPARMGFLVAARPNCDLYGVASLRLRSGKRRDRPLLTGLLRRRRLPWTSTPSALEDLTVETFYVHPINLHLAWRTRSPATDPSPAARVKPQRLSAEGAKIAERARADERSPLIVRGEIIGRG